jgi:glycogen(starch) synthase
MKILYWTPFFWPTIGGIEILSMKALPALRDRDYDFVVVTSHDGRDLPDEEQYDGIPVHRFPFLTSLSKGNLSQVVKIQREVTKLKQTYKPDLIHLHLGGPISYFHLKTADAHPAVTLVTLHTSFAGYKGADTLLAQTLTVANWVTAVSDAMLEDARSVVRGISHHSSVIYNGLDMPRLEPDPLQFDMPRILCLGRLIHEKGFDLAINAFALLVDRFPQARLTIAGDGPARLDLEHQATLLGLTEAVEFTGWVNPEDVPMLMNKATVVVVPSRWREPFPLVALEAAQMARPVVATHVGGLPESVVHEQTGLLVEKDDSQTLAEAIAFLLDHPDVAIRMGQAGRSRMQNVFSWERYIDAYDLLYRGLIQEFQKSHAK